MKFLLSILLLAVTSVILVACAPNYDHTEDSEFHSLVRSCAIEQAISQDDALNSMLVPMESPGNCVVACMWRKLYLVYPTGRINKGLLMESIRPMLDEMPTIGKMSDDTFLNCMDEGNKFDDNCQVVAGFFSCLMRDLFNLESIKSS